MNNNGNSQSLLKVKNVILKPNFKTKSLNFLDFTFYYFTQQKFVLRWKIPCPRPEIPYNRKEYAGLQVKAWKSTILSNIRKSATQKRENPQLENAEKICPFLLCESLMIYFRWNLHSGEMVGITIRNMYHISSFAFFDLNSFKEFGSLCSSGKFANRRGIL